MNIRPIDLQVLILRSEEASKAQQVTNQQPMVEQQQYEHQWQQAMVKRQRQVQGSNKNEGSKIEAHDHRQRDHNSRHRQKKRRAVKQLQTGDAPHDQVRGSHIDIKT